MTALGAEGRRFESCLPDHKQPVSAIFDNGKKERSGNKRNTSARFGATSHGIVPDGSPPVLIGCEYSAIERDAFRAAGFDAWSCDLKPTDGDPRWHIQGDIREAIRSRGWGMIILHLDCTRMAVCGNRHYGKGKPKHHERIAALEEAEEIARLALEAAPYVAIENPASVIFPMLRERLGADVQYIQPWQHGHMEQKKTGFATWGLPQIKPSADVYDEMMILPRKQRERIFFMSPSVTRGHERSRAYPGIASALVEQWGDILSPTPKDMEGCDAPLS